MEAGLGSGGGIVVEDELVEDAVGELIKVVVARLGEAGSGQDEDEEYA
jgi:hypothetical protein